MTKQHMDEINLLWCKLGQQQPHLLLPLGLMVLLGP